TVDHVHRKAAEICHDTQRSLELYEKANSLKAETSFKQDDADGKNKYFQNCMTSCHKAVKLYNDQILTAASSTTTLEGTDKHHKHHKHRNQQPTHTGTNVSQMTPQPSYPARDAQTPRHRISTLVPTTRAGPQELSHSLSNATSASSMILFLLSQLQYAQYAPLQPPSCPIPHGVTSPIPPVVTSPSTTSFAIPHAQPSPITTCIAFTDPFTTKHNLITHTNITPMVPFVAKFIHADHITISIRLLISSPQQPNYPSQRRPSSSTGILFAHKKQPQPKPQYFPSSPPPHFVTLVGPFPVAPTFSASDHSSMYGPTVGLPSG
ncbi:Vacuolar protein-sorting-associated protein 27, partial [Paramarasmius palmivorus]